MTGRKHLGVCSNFLAKRKAGEPCRVFIKDTKSTFRLPQDGSTPVILVGPGTGLAPLRGFLQDREASKATGAAMLFFGCRNSHDYIYREELEAFKERGVLTELLVAFSRPKDGSPKVYVQHLIAANAERVGSLLREGAHVYVCGDAKAMAPDVRAAINAILGEGGVDKMVAAQRYHEDVWAS
jgi:cytochrome P450 / NADPH-cytochrome P450 reductase